MIALNAMFKHKSNTTCNNILFSSLKIADMHKQMERLYEAASTLKGITGQSELARALNTSPQTVNNWEARGVSKQGMLTAQRVIGCSAVWVETGKDQMRVSNGTDERLSPSASQVVLREVPIVGTTQGGSGGFWDELGYPVGYGAEVVAVVSRDQTAYALVVKGSSMHPRYREGEAVLVEPGTGCHSGDEVVIRTVDGQVMLKELVSRRGGMVTLDSLDPAHERKVLREEEIIFMHYAAGRINASAIRPAVFHTESYDGQDRRHYPTEERGDADERRGRFIRDQPEYAGWKMESGIDKRRAEEEAERKERGEK